MKYTTDEALSEIMLRSEQVKAKKERRKAQIRTGVIGILSLVLLIGGGMLSDKVAMTSEGSVYGSFLLSQQNGGYVLVALVAFVIGIVVTLLCLRNKRKQGNLSAKGDENTRE